MVSSLKRTCTGRFTYVDKIDECIANAAGYVNIGYHNIEAESFHLLAVICKIDSEVHEIVLSPA